MFKVLVIAYYFPPMGLSGVQRTAKFVKYMKNYNWDPTVLTTGNVAYFAHDNSLLKEVEEANVKIIRTAGNDPNSLLAKFGTVKMPNEFLRKLFNKISQVFFIPDNKISWSKKVFETASGLLEKEKFDIIFVTIPPFSSFVTASKLKQKYNLPLVVDYRDLWYDSYLGFYPTPYHKIKNKKLEYTSLKIADKIVVTNRRIKEKMIDTYRFLTFEDVVIIQHGYDPEDFEKTTPELKPRSKMLLTYSGIFYEHNTPEYFLKAFKKLSVEFPEVASKIQLQFVGYLGKKNQKLVKKLQLQQDVKEFGYLSHKETIKKIITSDVLWMMLGKWKHNETILPGKLMEYFGTRKPVIACVPDGASKLLAEEYGAAFITKPDDIEHIKETIKIVYQEYIDGTLPEPDEEFVERFRRDFLTEQLTKLFQQKVRTEVQ